MSQLRFASGWRSGFPASPIRTSTARRQRTRACVPAISAMRLSVSKGWYPWPAYQPYSFSPARTSIRNRRRECHYRRRDTPKALAATCADTIYAVRVMIWSSTTTASDRIWRQYGNTDRVDCAGRCGYACRIAQPLKGGLCYKASTRPFSRTGRSSATRSCRQLPGWILHG
jgi:hypothetical protein